MKKIVPCIALCAGITLISCGVWLIYKPAGYIILGILILLAVFAVDFDKKE